MLTNVSMTVSRNLSLGSILLRCRRQWYLLDVCKRNLRSGSSKPIDQSSSDQLTVLNENGSMIVSWHPEQDFPYECSKPMPVLEPSIREGDSILKLQYRLDDSKRHSPDGPDMKELMRLTFTNKHIWYPRGNKKYRFPQPPVDRPGL